MGIDAVILCQLPKPTDSKELLALSYQISSTIGREHFWIENKENHALEFYPDYEASVSYPYGEQEPKDYIRVRTMMRYWGPGYERGNWPIIRSMIEWFWHNIPGCKVLYGGDSSDYQEEMTAEKMEEFSKHFYLTGRKGYTRSDAWNLNNGDKFSKKLPICPVCEVETLSCGGGGNKTFCVCDGCDYRTVTWPGGKKDLKKGEDFFTVEL